MISTIPNFLLLLLIFCLQGTSSSNAVVVRDPEQPGHGVPARRLSAAHSGKQMARRDVRGCLRHDHDLHYLDASTTGSDSAFGAKVAVGFKTPTLLLEEIEHHITTVECHDSRVYLYFSSAKALKHAHREIGSVGEFLLITSHDGCNVDDERTPYLVSEAAVHVEDRTIILSTVRVSWKHTFDTMTVEFGEGVKGLVPRPHNELYRRQAAATSQTAAPSLTRGASAASTSYAYPAAPSSTASSINVTGNIDKSYINTTILPPDSSLGPVPMSGSKISPDLSIRCRNCTFHGSINLVAGSLTMGPFVSNNTGGYINRTEAVYDYITNGFLEIRSTGFGAHVELDSTIGASADILSYTVPLPTIPITPLQIPGIASVGPQFEPSLTTGFQLEADLEFGYGFEVTVPDNSSLVLDLAKRNGSSQRGFDDTTVNSLPFQAYTPKVELTVTAAFSPRLLLGISFFSGDAIAGAGFFLDTPALSSTFSTVSHVDANCNNATGSTAKDAIFDTLTHVEASAEVGLGVIAQAQVLFEGDDLLQDEGKYTVLGKTFALPTGCLSFDTAAKTYGVANKATRTAAAGSKSSHSVGSAGFAQESYGRSRAAFAVLILVQLGFTLM